MVKQPNTPTTDLFRALYKNGSTPHEGELVSTYQDFIKRLSAVAHKSPAWSWQYLKSVLHFEEAEGRKGIAPSKLFMRAVEVLSAEVNGIPAIVVNTEPVMVYALPGSVRAGALLIGKSFRCAYLPCTIVEVKTHPRQIYCHVHRDPKARKP